MSDPALFEVGPEYKNATPTGQRTVAAGLRSNMAVPRNWTEPARAVDAFDAKADALAVLAAIGTPMDNLSTQPGAPDWYHPGRSGLIKLGDRVMAQFGELHPEIVAARRLQGPGGRLRGLPRRAAAAQGQGDQGAAEARACRLSSRWSATSPSSSMPRSRPRSWCAPRATPTRRW